MTARTHALPTLGFLSVIEDEQLGFLGGYLVLNVAGRPVEFHCTAPVKPSRTQQILYGPTLKPVLYAEQIGPAMLEKPKDRPLFVCTDAAPCLAIRDAFQTPIVYLAGGENVGAESVDEPRGAHPFSLGACSAAVLGRHAGDEQVIAHAWRTWLADFDLHEPFGRIREAIQEAQRSVRPAA